MESLAYKDTTFFERRRKEILDGKTVLMSPSPSTNHQIVVGNIHRLFSIFFKGKTCRAFVNGPDIHLTKKDIVLPDVFIVCNKDIIKWNGIYGAPDLVVEVLSPGTMKNDRGYKKDLYEKHGVKEYWLVDSYNLSIEVYLLENNKYILNNTYMVHPDYMLEVMTEEEKSEIKYEFVTESFSDLTIPLDEVFEGIL